MKAELDAIHAEQPPPNVVGTSHSGTVRVWERVGQMAAKAEK